MKKFIFLSIVLLLLAGFAITSSAAMRVPLFADTDMEVGFIVLKVEKDCLLVSYFIDEKWELLETHLYVGTVEPTKSAPGRFPYRVTGTVLMTIKHDSGSVAHLLTK